MKEIIRYTVAVIAIALILYLLDPFNFFPRSELSLEHTKAPDFTLLDYQGNQFSLSQASSGSAVFLTFWFPSCAACRAELPRLQSIQEKYGREKLKIVAVEVTGNDKAASQFISNNGLNFTFLRDSETAPVNDLYQVTLYPTSYLIDKEGMIHKVFIGFSPGREHEIEEEIRHTIAGQEAHK